MIEVILFTGEHCVGCKPMKEKVEKLKKEFGSKYKFKTYDIDDEEVIGQLMMYNVRSVPCLVIKRNNAVVNMFIGDTDINKMRESLEGL